MQSPRAQSGRTRIVVTVTLIVLIGLAGALVLPRLLHEAAPPIPPVVQAEVCLGVPADGLAAAGTVHVTAARPGLPPFLVEEALPAGADTDAVVGLLRAACGSTGWEDASPRVNGTCLSFPGVTAIGGDPGTTDVPMSWSMSARPGQALVLRIRLAGGPTAPVQEAAMRVALSGRGVVRGPHASVAGGAAAYEGTWQGARAALEGLAGELRAAGWTVEEEDEGGGLLVRALPLTEALGSAILTVEYDAPEGERAQPPYAWTLELVR